jgi:hypothetical protein
MKNPYDSYLKNVESKFEFNKQNIKTALEKARNKNTTISIFIDQYRVQFTDSQKELYVLGIGDFFQLLQQALDIDKNRTEEDAFNQLCFPIHKAGNKLDHLVNYQVSKQIIQFLEEMRENECSKEELKTLNWGGIEQTEFIQLIYSLIESGLINDKDKIGKYKIVDRFAKFFNFELHKNWPDILSSSIHDRNNEYSPNIFNQLKMAWENYRDSRLNKK